MTDAVLHITGILFIIPAVGTVWEEFDELPLAVEVAMETLAEESERSLEEVRAMEKELGAYWRATR